MLSPCTADPEDETAGYPHDKHEGLGDSARNAYNGSGEDLLALDSEDAEHWWGRLSALSWPQHTLQPVAACYTLYRSESYCSCWLLQLTVRSLTGPAVLGESAVHVHSEGSKQGVKQRLSSMRVSRLVASPEPSPGTHTGTQTPRSQLDDQEAR